MTVALKPPKQPSTAVHSYGYDPASKTLAIRFHRKDGPGDPHHYREVPEHVAHALNDADSVGKFFANHIRGKYDHEVIPAGAVDHEGSTAD